MQILLKDMVSIPGGHTEVLNDCRRRRLDPEVGDANRSLVVRSEISNDVQVRRLLAAGG